MSRYSNRRTIINTSEVYEDLRRTRNVKSVNLKATDRTGLTNPIVQTVVFVTSRNTGATTSVIIKNDSTGQFPND